MTQVLRVTDWDKHFENNRTRDMKFMSWLPVPNKHDGDGFTDLLGRKNGTALYGAWHLILQVASKCEPRGTLLRDSRTLVRGSAATKIPHTAATIARQSRGDEKVIADAIVALLEIGWIEWQTIDDNEVTQIPQEGAGKPQEGAAIPHPTDDGTERNGIDRNGKENDGTEPAASPRARATCTESQAAAIYAMYPRKIKPIPAKKAIREAVQRIAESGNDDPLAFLQARVLAYAASESAKPPPAGETDWRPHPASWFNSGSYDNDDIEWTKPNGSGSSKNHRTQSSVGIRRNEVAAGHHPEPDRPVPTSL